MSSTIFFVALVICVSNNLVMTNVNTNTNMPNINIPIASIEPMYHMKRNVAEHILVVHMGVRYYLYVLVIDFVVRYVKHFSKNLDQIWKWILQGLKLRVKSQKKQENT